MVQNDLPFYHKLQMMLESFTKACDDEGGHHFLWMIQQSKIRMSNTFAWWSQFIVQQSKEVINNIFKTTSSVVQHDIFSASKGVLGILENIGSTFSEYIKNRCNKDYEAVLFLEAGCSQDSNFFDLKTIKQAHLSCYGVSSVDGKMIAERFKNFTEENIKNIKKRPLLLSGSIEFLVHSFRHFEKLPMSNAAEFLLSIFLKEKTTNIIFSTECYFHDYNPRKHALEAIERIFQCLNKNDKQLWISFCIKPLFETILFNEKHQTGERFNRIRKILQKWKKYAIHDIEKINEHFLDQDWKTSRGGIQNSIKKMIEKMKFDEILGNVFEKVIKGMSLQQAYERGVFLVPQAWLGMNQIFKKGIYIPPGMLDWTVPEPSAHFVVRGGRGSGKSILAQMLAEKFRGSKNYQIMIRLKAKSETLIKQTIKEMRPSDYLSIQFLDEETETENIIFQFFEKIFEKAKSKEHKALIIFDDLFKKNVLDLIFRAFKNFNEKIEEDHPSLSPQSLIHIAIVSNLPIGHDIPFSVYCLPDALSFKSAQKLAHNIFSEDRNLSLNLHQHVNVCMKMFEEYRTLHPKILWTLRSWRYALETFKTYGAKTFDYLFPVSYISASKNRNLSGSDLAKYLNQNMHLLKSWSEYTRHHPLCWKELLIKHMRGDLLNALLKDIKNGHFMLLSLKKHSPYCFSSIKITDVFDDNRNSEKNYYLPLLIFLSSGTKVFEEVLQKLFQRANISEKQIVCSRETIKNLWFLRWVDGLEKSCDDVLNYFSSQEFLSLSFRIKDDKSLKTMPEALLFYMESLGGLFFEKMSKLKKNCLFNLSRTPIKISSFENTCPPKNWINPYFFTFDFFVSRDFIRSYFDYTKKQNNSRDCSQSFHYKYGSYNSVTGLEHVLEFDPEGQACSFRKSMFHHWTRDPQGKSFVVDLKFFCPSLFLIEIFRIIDKIKRDSEDNNFIKKTEVQLHPMISLSKIDAHRLDATNFHENIFKKVHAVWMYQPDIFLNKVYPSFIHMLFRGGFLETFSEDLLEKTAWMMDPLDIFGSDDFSIQKIDKNSNMFWLSKTEKGIKIIEKVLDIFSQKFFKNIEKSAWKNLTNNSSPKENCLLRFVDYFSKSKESALQILSGRGSLGIRLIRKLFEKFPSFYDWIDTSCLKREVVFSQKKYPIIWLWASCDEGVELLELLLEKREDIFKAMEKLFFHHAYDCDILEDAPKGMFKSAYDLLQERSDKSKTLALKLADFNQDSSPESMSASSNDVRLKVR